MIKAAFPALIFLFVVSSCSEPADGGPCEYDTDTVSAKVIAVDSNGSDYPDVRIEFPIKPSGTDTMLYYTMNNESLSWKQCDSLGIVVGKEMKVERMYITEGHCSPELFQVVK